MKNALLATGGAFLLAVLLSSPTFAQTPAKPAAPEVVSETTSPDEAAIADATTPEDRARLLLRCAGPPPRAALTASAPPKQPASEPAVLSDAG